jgi:hypothetical protein
MLSDIALIFAVARTDFDVGNFHDTVGCHRPPPCAGSRLVAAVVVRSVRGGGQACCRRRSSNASNLDSDVNTLPLIRKSGFGKQTFGFSRHLLIVREQTP